MPGAPFVYATFGVPGKLLYYLLSNTQFVYASFGVPEHPITRCVATGYGPCAVICIDKSYSPFLTVSSSLLNPSPTRVHLCALGRKCLEAHAGASHALLDLRYGPQAWGDAWGETPIPVRISTLLYFRVFVPMRPYWP